MNDPDQRPEFSSCGVGFLVQRYQAATHDILQQALQALRCVEHRGACGADQLTGDGAGVMTDIPFDLFGFKPGTMAVATLFMPQSQDRMRLALKVFESTFRFYGLHVDCYRAIPVDASILGEEARRTLPSMSHCFIARPAHCRTNESFERVLYAARQRTRTELFAQGISKEFFFTSLSASTIIYKGLVRSDMLDQFYLDLRDPGYTSRFALFHRRFSTNTRTTWDKAQPFRLIGHNGEINTIAGNRSWAVSREMSLGVPKDQLLTHSGISDSGSLNEMVEALMNRSGIPHVEDVLAIMMPPAHDQSDFYKFWSRAMEPWDGPAIIMYADGNSVGARLDRNGFRPARWTLTDEVFYLSSEAGSFAIDERAVQRRGAMNAGTGVKVDLKTGRVHFRDASRSRENRDARFDPRTVTLCLENGESFPGQPWAPEDTSFARQHLFLLTKEERDQVLVPMVRDGREPIGSMGDTARPNVFSAEPRPFYDYFYQNFAQVTNPPVDYLRERNVTDLRVFLGRKPNIFFAKDLLPLEEAIELPGPIIGLRAMRAIETLSGKRPSESHIIPRLFPMVFDRAAGTAGLRPVVEHLVSEVQTAVDGGCTVIILSDRTATVDRPPIPALIALRAVVQQLNESGRRLNASIVVESAEVRTPHHVAALIAFGASAVCPSLALALARSELCATEASGTPDEREARLLGALEGGLLKIMSKSGISVVQSYHSSKLFTAIGLGPELMEDFFPGQPTLLGGIGFEELADDILWKTSLGQAPEFATDLMRTYQYREHNQLRRGERHSLTSARARAVHAVVKQTPETPEQQAATSRYLEMGQESEPISVRHLFELTPLGSPLDLSEVESRDAILARFGAGAMSFGAISAEAQRDIFVAMRKLGARSNSGEGGENPYYFTDGITATTKQVASARFGVTAEYLAVADEIQIKIAQGAKPGEGGQLMGVKVTESIARARYAPTGVDLISPPPLHDIYSIEDLKELIYELRQVKPEARISVKLVSGANVGTIAVGAVKAGADIVYVSGGDGGTGAATLGSMKHAGLPWEFGLMDAHRALVENNLRSSVELRTDGGLLTGKDVVMAALLGAEGYDFGKLVLVSQGCVMARVCEKNTCPAGIATHDPKFTQRYKGTPEDIVTMLTVLADDVRRQLAAVGVRTLGELVGRTTLLRVAAPHATFVRDRRLDLGFFLHPVPAVSSPAARLVREGVGPLNARVAADVDARLAAGETDIALRYPITTADRGVLATVSGALASRVAAQRLRREATVRHPLDGVRVALGFEGCAGQGFGAFLETGLEVTLTGEANDGVAKSMAGGVVAVHPGAGLPCPPELNAIIGNGALYGATGGSLFVSGLAGDRFAVRNSGAVAVVDGVGLHACEYMTRGFVVVTGPVSHNAGAGMTGGTLVLRGEHARFVNGLYLRDEPLDDDDANRVEHLLREHVLRTGSPASSRLLAAWADERRAYRSFVPRTGRRA